jgi:uroporphyrinogen III methyltransferase/synthase
MTPSPVYLVGAGPGAPGLITVRGLNAVRQATVIIYDRLVHPALIGEAPPTAHRIYVGKESGIHCVAQARINQLLVKYATQGERVVRLKGGDPFVFGRGGEEAEVLVEAGIPFEVIPGVSSAVAAPAYAGIPVTHRKVASSFAVITGHEEGGKEHSAIDWARLATAVDTLIILMGTKGLGRITAQLVRHGRSSRTPVAVVRWGTTSEQYTLVGTLADIAAKAAAVNLEPPAVTVVGDVVNLAEQLRWFCPAVDERQQKQVTFAARQSTVRCRRKADAVPPAETRPVQSSGQNPPGVADTKLNAGDRHTPDGLRVARRETAPLD